MLWVFIFIAPSKTFLVCVSVNVPNIRFWEEPTNITNFSFLFYFKPRVFAKRKQDLPSGMFCFAVCLVSITGDVLPGMAPGGHTPDFSNTDFAFDCIFNPDELMPGLVCPSVVSLCPISPFCLFLWYNRFCLQKTAAHFPFLCSTAFLLHDGLGSSGYNILWTVLKLCTSLGGSTCCTLCKSNTFHFSTRSYIFYCVYSSMFSLYLPTFTESESCPSSATWSVFSCFLSFIPTINFSSSLPFFLCHTPIFWSFLTSWMTFSTLVSAPWSLPLFSFSSSPCSLPFFFPLFVYIWQAP